MTQKKTKSPSSKKQEVSKKKEELVEEKNQSHFYYEQGLPGSLQDIDEEVLIDFLCANKYARSSLDLHTLTLVSSEILRRGIM